MEELVSCCFFLTIKYFGLYLCEKKSLLGRRRKITTALEYACFKYHLHKSHTLIEQSMGHLHDDNCEVNSPSHLII